MGKYPKDRGGTPQRRTSFANDGFPYPLWPFGPSPPDRGSRPPVPPITGVTPWVRQKISGAQNLSGWSKSLPAHWGLTLWKIASGAVQQPRLALPNQRSRCVSWREPQGPPLQRDYVHISRLESCSLIRPLRGHLPPGEGFWATARVAPTAYSAPVLLVRKQQAQLWNRTGNNFCKPRAQWPGGDSDQPLHFCAPEMMYYLPVGRPP